MLHQELIDLVKNIKVIKSEYGALELKSALGGAPKIYDTLSAFSNQAGGGIIVFGITERDYSVCGVYDVADLQTKISECCLQMEPPVRAVCTAAEIDGKTVVSAEIPELEVSKRPCFYKGTGRIGGSYIRVGDADCKMTEYEIYSYEAYRTKIHDELRIVPRTELFDIQTPHLNEYMTKLSIAKPNLSDLPIERKLELQGFLVASKPTLVSTLLFCEYPQSYFPRLCITAVVVDGDSMGDLSERGERFIDNIRLEGTISQMLNGALAFVRRNMKKSTVINPETGMREDKTEYPITAVRELILNALVHRDYSIHTDSTPITIEMYNNRIEIENPGGLYGRLTLDSLGHTAADTRNPYLANAMEITEDTENRFSGIPTVRRAMKNAGLPQPLFESKRGVFKATLFNSFGDDNLATHNANENKRLSALTLEEKILDFCKTSRTRDEIANRFPNLTRTYLFTKYVSDLVASGQLTLGIPDKPKSSRQTYVVKE